MIRFILLMIVIGCRWTLPMNAQPSSSSGWPDEGNIVEIPSSIDATEQKAYFYPSFSSEEQPLIVSLHSWSGDYTQKDPLVWQCLHNDWNYIHPDFRGPNNTPKACGSEYVLSDIEDAISYAIEKGNVKESEIHVIGASGGGYATLLSFLTTDLPVKSFSAWVPISDLEAWYYESLGRGNKYAGDILKSTSPGSEMLEVVEARRRSPFFMPIPEDIEERGTLHIYAGIHDGYTGSVPITQSMKMYNRLIRASGAEYDELIGNEEMLKLVTQRTNPQAVNPVHLADRLIHLHKSYKNSSLTLFEGGHEMLAAVALDHVTCCGEIKPNPRILTIGDSNGASEDGWVEQLKRLRPLDVIFNVSVSGNTLGFDNNGKESLNTLKNIDRYLEETLIHSGDHPIDLIMINLGTNDCKAIFESRQQEVPQHLETLIQRIQSYSYPKEKVPQIVIISPPPYGPDEVLLDKYKGGDQRVQTLLPQFKSIANKYHCHFIDIYNLLKPKYSELAPDGVHMKSEGQKLMSETIHRYLNEYIK